SNDRKLVDRDDVAAYESGSKSPRTPMVLGLVPTLPGSLLVSAKSSRMDFYLVDAATGALKVTASQTTRDEGQGFADRQGKVRIFQGPNQVLRTHTFAGVRDVPSAAL